MWAKFREGRGAAIHARWIMIFLVVGIAARLIRYLLRFPLWGDEAMLAMNFLNQDYAGLMRPLNFHQVAPLLFLWIELTAVKLLGFNEWSLRLFPLLCSLASLLLFERLARLVLHGPARLLAVGMFAVTYSALRYSAEVKPYAVDLMVSTLLLFLAVRWWRQPDDTRWLWALVAVVPLALGLSFPAVFIGGGVSVAIAAVLVTARSRRGWLAWGIFNLVLVGSFFVWYKLAVSVQAGAELSLMAREWDAAFPPRDSVLSLLKWLPRAHAGPLLAVPVGGSHWGSIGTTLMCLVAAVVLIRKGRYRLLALCLAPFALNLIAAALHRFPYGGHMRLTLYLVPLVCIPAAVGAAAVFSWLGGKRATSLSPQAARTAGNRLSWPVAVAVIGLLILVGLSTARDFYLPGKEQQEIRRRDFAAWFWGSMERDHEMVCVWTDLRRAFAPPGALWECCISPLFICNERIYSPRHARGQGYDLSRVSRQRPLVYVQYWTHDAPYDQAAFDRWLAEATRDYKLVATHRYPILRDNDDDRVPEPPDRVETYEFVPKS